MNKAMFAIGVAALCGSVMAIESSVVGYETYTKTQKNETMGCMFISPGSSTGRFKLSDLQIVGSLTTPQKKNNYIQMMNPLTATFSSTNSFYREGTAWAYRNGELSGKLVPADLDFPAGTGFLVIFANSPKLQFSGEVMKPVPNADGYIEISRPVVGGVTAQRFFVANPFPVSIHLNDMKIIGTMTTPQKKNNFLQKFKASVATLDASRAYYWNTNKWSNRNITGDPENFEIKPGEGFYVQFSNNVKLGIKVPDAIKNL